ncbi:MAG: type IV pilin protein [Actinomycetota bacterium]
MRSFPEREDGFSLVEIMVVVLIIAVLIGIAIPTFLGMRQRAQDAAAKDSAALSLKIARGFATDENEDFSTLSTSSMNENEPSLTFVDGDVSSQGSKEVSQMVADAGAGDEIFVAAVQSESGACFFVRMFAHGGTDYGEVAGTDCRAADNGSVVFGPSW